MKKYNVIYLKEKALVPPVGPDITFEGYSDRKDTDIKYVRADAVEESFKNAAYKIVCKMIDMGMIESEPEGISFEFDIVEILKKTCINNG